ncbi:putative dsba oxidoreductase protein [Neofusicoccum parvum UCRNP2]|uniref:Putative dsba oxidoreductase protein n=1 Tax=Botryosphaeria parva (strain UCR-NP2) TaxID=1287680 RepID=R1GL74_BOTPV|nr:putative dsba oxidoreductase protein [Neofusicoccum parvum UCRNP2]
MTHFNIDIVSDTVCPWCYVGKKRLERAIATHQQAHPADTFSTTWYPFYLDPTAPTPGEDKQARYARRFGAERTALMQQRLAQIGAAEGIYFKFGGRTGNTRDSHRLVQLGKTKSPAIQTRVVEELFAAYFENEKDITDRAVLKEAGVAAGLEGREVEEWLKGGKGGKEVDEEVEGARRKFISGVPNFTVNGKYEVGGAEDPAAFLEVFEEVKRAER